MNRLHRVLPDELNPTTRSVTSRHVTPSIYRLRDTMEKTCHADNFFDRLMTMTVQKASSKDAKKSTRSALGAPTQLGQSSRKGKRAWRKNIDIQDVEKGMESLRTEERVLGCDLMCLYICVRCNLGCVQLNTTETTRRPAVRHRYKG